MGGITMKLSIVTPTYQRATLLPRLYQSIVENKEEQIQIQWLIMDDGSTDTTKQVIEEFQQENKIEIQYYYQENQGKMKAINALIPKVTGDFIIECDSDDYFTKGAFSTIQKDVITMEEDIYALCYLKYDQTGQNLGNHFRTDKTTMFDLYFKQQENGEKVLVFNASIRKQYKHQLENKERFITEARMYHQMDKTYYIQCHNVPIMICEYQKDGYTNQILNVFKQNPYGYYEYFKEMFEHNLKGIYLKKRLYLLKHYILFSVLTHKTWKQLIPPVKGIGNRIGVTILYFPGKWKTKKKFQ